MTTRYKKMEIKRKAFTLLDLLKDTGKLVMKEAHKRHYGDNQSDRSHTVNAARDMFTPEVYEEFIKLLRVDSKAVEKLDGKGVIKDILDDIHKINLALESPDIGLDEFNKLLNTKSVKQKLLGSFLGIWNAERPQETKETDPDKIWAARNKGLLS